MRKELSTRNQRVQTTLSKHNKFSINIFTSYDEYISSKEWKILREKALQRDKRRCRICDSGINLTVHHRRYPAILGTESVDDLTTLCRDCHNVVELHKQGLIRVKKVILKQKKIPKTKIVDWKNLDI